MASPIPTDYKTKSKPSLNFHWLAPWIYTNKYKILTDNLTAPNRAREVFTPNKKS